MNDSHPRLRGGQTRLDDHCDVWTLDLARAAAASPHYWPLLDDAERHRAARFLRAEVADRFVAARGVLRLLLGRYLALPPHHIRFHVGAYGKPSLASDAGVPRLAFNVSHSGDIAAFCVSRHGPVGVDVEWFRTVANMRGLLERVGTSDERRYFDNSTAAAQAAWFFRLWTRKEAVSKAIGLGMRLPFDHLQVMHEAAEGEGFEPGTCQLTVSDPDGGEPTGWLIRDLPAAVTYCGALATPAAQTIPVRQWEMEVVECGDVLARAKKHWITPTKSG